MGRGSIFVRRCFTGVAAGYCIGRFLAEPVLLQGPSMEPTIRHNDLVLTNKFSATFSSEPYNRGDIIVTRSPLDPKQFICKRIVALPGDTVRGDLFRKTVPKGHVWLLGDNTNNSTDSRQFGSLPMGLIVGKVVCRVWPPHRVRSFDHRDDL